MKKRAEAGFTVIEALVSLALLATILLALLGIYDRLLAAYRQGTDAAGAQQNVIVAFSRMVEEIRMAGVGINPDGDPARPDEPLEGIWSGAVTFRADMDDADPSDRDDPERTLGGASMPFSTVTTGNDEIVTYALGSPGTGMAIRFVADVRAVPRDGITEVVTVPRVEMNQTDPPYTLYRITVAASGASVLRRPVADGILALSFDYFDRNGDPITPVGGDDTPAEVEVRATVDRIGITMIGLAEGSGRESFTLKTRVQMRGRMGVGGFWFDPDLPGGPALSL